MSLPRPLLPLALAFVACFLALLPAASKAQERVGSVVHHEGTVLALRQQGSTPLITGAPVFADDRIFTNADARARINFTDGSALAIGPGSLVIISDYQYEQNGPVDAAFSLFLGIVQGIVGPAAENGRFDIRTQMAVASARSTRFVVTVDEGGHQMAVFVIAGRVAVTPTEANLRTVELEEDFGIDIERGVTEAIPERWGSARIGRVLSLTDTPE